MYDWSTSYAKLYNFSYSNNSTIHHEQIKASWWKKTAWVVSGPPRVSTRRASSNWIIWFIYYVSKITYLSYMLYNLIIAMRAACPGVFIIRCYNRVNQLPESSKCVDCTSNTSLCKDFVCICFIVMDSTSTVSSVRSCHRVSSLNCTAKLKSPAVLACLGVYPLDMPRTPYRASEGKRSQ